MRVWQRSDALALNVYRLTIAVPTSARFGITSQGRRTVVSVSGNIAEGANSESNREYAHFLNIAEGSPAETGSLAAPADVNAPIEESEEVSIVRALCGSRWSERSGPVP